MNKMFKGTEIAAHIRKARGADCYDWRGECLFGDPPEWIEDCLNNGGNRHSCCNEVFYDCMAGC